MKIKSITIQGFRGFNTERSLDLHDGLTLIYGPNSYGKTSISEALEWLLYGNTSKVEGAESKEEYRNSYRNPHLPSHLKPFVKTIFTDVDSEVEFYSELSDKDTISRSVDSTPVFVWPLLYDITASPKPFVLQHSLKDLLLATPDKRFHGFARLLGLEVLDQIQSHIISLSTKPDAGIPPEAKRLRQEISTLEAKLSSRIALAPIARAIKKGFSGLDATYSAILVECRRRIPPETPDASVLPQLLKLREETVGKVFTGRLSLVDLSGAEKQRSAEDEAHFLSYVTESLIQEYLQLITLSTVSHVLERARFFELGVNLLNKEPETCPFCGQGIADPVSQHIIDEHASLTEQQQAHSGLQKQRAIIVKGLQDLRSRITVYHGRHAARADNILSSTFSLLALQAVLMPKHETNFRAVEATISDLRLSLDALVTRYNALMADFNTVEESLSSSTEDAALLRQLGENLVDYITVVRSWLSLITQKAPPMGEADAVLRHELDIIAGTEDVSILIELLEKRQLVERKFKIELILTDLKELRRITDQYVAEKILAGVANDLTKEVMEWYGQMRTSGDPDVHFDGFDLERTQKGTVRARKVEVKAMSYGKKLASAVSSLSESKLNALGLCVSIASNLRGKSAFDFLVIDDPIQSWDDGHEIQFIEVIRNLVERGKQVIVLSHRQQWLKQVRMACRSLNGTMYELTGYSESGPNISPVDWEEWRERLKAVDGILKDQSAGSLRIQQAEEEIRLVMAELTAKLYLKKIGIPKAAHRLNSADVRKLLMECGVDNSLRDRVVSTFATTDEAHHSGGDYAAARERIRQYHGWAHELGRLLG